MKIAESTIVVQSSGVQSEAFFTVKDKNVGHIFSILRNKLYSNKPLAIIREYCTNAFDAHVEAGIRSNDWSMPEEINRLVTDAITNYFFTTSDVANTNLKASGYGDDQIFFVGNCMIDTLLANRPRFIKPSIWEELGLSEKGYFMMTLHRPANVDEGSKLKELMDEIINNTLELVQFINTIYVVILFGKSSQTPHFHFI